MALTAEEITRAEKIIDTWFWQIDETRAYGYRGALNVITRFYESAPMSADIMKLVLDYLNSQEKMTKVSLNNKLVSLDGEWKAVAAFYRTAQGQNWAGTESSKVRVYQMIAKMGDEEGDGPYTVEDGCKYKVTHKFHWNTAEEPALPASTSGVQYTLGGLTRDKETGLFSYVIECRETVQQDVEFYDTAITSFEKLEEALHLGVKADKVESTGLQASAANGVLVERKVTKNPDCTSDIQNRRTTEQAVSNAVVVKRKSVRGVTTSITDRNQATDGAAGEPTKIGETYRSEKTPGGLFNNTVETFKADGNNDLGSRDDNTIFESANETSKAQDDKPSEKITDAGGGKYHSRTVRANDEGGYDVTNRTTTEQAVSNAVVVKRKSVRGITTSVTNRNQSVSEATLDPTEIGETRRSEKTPGGLYNNTIETFKADGNNDLAERQDNTIFESASETTKAQDEKPTGKITDAGGGKYHSRTVRANDEGGYDVTNRTTEEKAQSNAIIVKRKSVRGITTSVTNRNQPSAEANGEPTKIGESLRSELTPGGLYNNTHETFEATAQSNLGSRDDNTVFESASETTKAQDIAPAGGITSAGQGKYHSRTVRANDEGGYDVTTRTTTEKAVTDAVVVKRKSVRGITTSITNRNQSVAEAALDPTEIGETRRSEKTAGGLYNNTIETFTSNGNTEISSREDNTVFESAEETTKAQDDKPTDTITPAGNGKHHSRMVRANDEGGYDVTERKTLEQAVSDAVVVKRKTLSGTVISTTDRNQPNQKTTQNPTKIGETYRSEKTPGGLFNNTVEKVDIESDDLLIDESLVEDNYKKEYSSTTNRPDSPELDADSESFEIGSITRKRYSKTDIGSTNETTSTITAKPTWHDFEWRDSRGRYHKVIYKNQSESMVESTIPRSALTSEAVEDINEFGLYDGTLVWKVSENDDDDGNSSSEILQWGRSNVSVEAKYYYVNGEGTLCTRTFSGLVDYCYGRTEAVIDAVADGEQVSAVGWTSGWTGNHEYAHGRRYHSVTVSAEEEVL